MKQSTFYYLLRRGVIGGGGSAAGPTNTVAPVISGTAERGETLTSTTGTWTGTGTISYAYQWKRSGADISGATSSTYVLVAADDNAFITCNVTATDDTGSRSKLSNSLGPVLAAPLSLTNPVASGTAQVGQTLSTTDGTWQGIATITFAYQWRRDAVNISGATSSTYTLVAADYTTDVDCVVTATNSLGSANADSNDIANIAGTAPVISGVPTISSQTQVGETITATAASVSGVPTPSTSWQWQRSADGSTGWSNISGATSSTYTLVLADDTNYVRAVQTSTNAVGSDSANSAASAQISSAPAYDYLLDDYSGAAAAYSLRLLDSTYTGDAIVVRRASDNTTQAIGFVDNELDTTSLESFCSGTDGFVTTWYDQSGNGNDAATTIGSNQPKIVASGSTILENGKPILQDGIGMSVNASITTSGYAQFAVAKNLSTGGKNIMNYYTEGGNSKYVLAAENDSSSTSVILAPNLNTKRLNGSSFSYSTRNDTWDNILNQSLITLNSDTESNVDSFVALGWTSSSWGMWDMQEFIVYPTNQSSNISGIETNINDHYSIY